MKIICYAVFLGFFGLLAFPVPSGAEATSPNPEAEKLTLVHAVMCEEISDRQPVNETIVFSVSLGQVICFNFFNPVPERTVIYHNWYKRDRLTSRVKLRVNPPRWSTFSRIQLREVDKGPWRVEITDGNGTVLRVLRFSITD
jgi:hypothetical protein